MVVSIVTVCTVLDCCNWINSMDVTTTACLFTHTPMSSIDPHSMTTPNLKFNYAMAVLNLRGGKCCDFCLDHDYMPIKYNYMNTYELVIQ